MPFNSGYYKRAKRRVNVLRGFNGCDPETFTRNAAVHADHAVGSGDEIKSGELISLSGGVWVKGAAVTAVPYIALSDVNDTDVGSSGLLPALSCAGQFEIETSHYDSGGSYDENTPLVADAVTPGLITDGALDASADIIGFASRGGLTNLNEPGTGPKIEVMAESGNILTFITRWMPGNPIV